MKLIKTRLTRLLLGLAACCAIAYTPAATAYDTAAATAAAQSEVCEDSQPFYWEIGSDSGSPIVSGQVGGTTYDRTTPVDLASASKWITATYILERYSGLPSGSEGTDIMNAMQMLEGHTPFADPLCEYAARVKRCHTIGLNEYVNNNKVGDFNYNSGDMQWVAASEDHLDLGDLFNSGLASEIDSYLDLGPSFNSVWPLLAGGYNMTAEDYAAFLQGLMDGTYVMSTYLGYNPVDTQCANCSSPTNTVDMDYSLFHWVENQTGGTYSDGTPGGTGDGAYSSAGAFGFYPWITSDKEYYGILSRQGEAGSGFVSVVCGQAIREAFLDE